MKYESWLIDWLNSYVKSTVKKRTYERYSGICTLHIIPSLGENDLAELSVIFFTYTKLTVNRLFALAIT